MDDTHGSDANPCLQLYLVCRFFQDSDVTLAMYANESACLVSARYLEHDAALYCMAD